MRYLKPKVWISLFLILFVCMVCFIIGVVVYVDPFMHYHSPKTSEFFYTLRNERSINDGIIKHFDYDAVITGSSMAENFKTSDLDGLFGVNSIKTPFSGGTYKEINDSLETAVANNPNLKMVVRSLDMHMFFQSNDAMRTDLGDYPTYLYNDNIFDDVYYVFNRDVLYSKCWSMIYNSIFGGRPGITSFDAYSNWMKNNTFGREAVFSAHPFLPFSLPQEQISDEELETIKTNIELNVISLAESNPSIDFYYFFPPYSIMWWWDTGHRGNLLKTISAEQYIIELILPHKNIHLFSWNNHFDLTTDLNNYKDTMHYGEWINTWMLQQMKTGNGLLTQENYKQYIEKELTYYLFYDYKNKVNTRYFSNSILQDTYPLYDSFSVAELQ